MKEKVIHLRLILFLANRRARMAHMECVEPGSAQGDLRFTQIKWGCTSRLPSEASLPERKAHSFKRHVGVVWELDRNVPIGRTDVGRVNR